ncbi:MAG: GGDEF domain-containing protein [Candidatus Sedimenticola sp. 6PFRAG5]
MKEKDTEWLRQLLSQADRNLVHEIHSIISPKALHIARKFYQQMIKHPKSSPFLDNKEVESKLQQSMAHWISSLLTAETKDEIDEFIRHQIHIGDRHARINVPLVAINLGTSVLKGHLFKAVLNSDMQQDRLVDAIILLNEIIDLTMSVMNRTYFTDMMTDARDQQALKLQSLGMDMALQTESLRSSLFDWHRQILGMWFDPGLDLINIPSILRTDFGLWVFHKGELLFPDSEEIVKLKETVLQIDAKFGDALAQRKKGWNDALRDALDHIDDHITCATSLLGALKEQTLALEGGRDPLTKLFNRRFLRTILQREILTSNSTGERFSVILADIDHFKTINDTHGHDAGDAILSQFAELLVNCVRAGDFVFRYGGEEFLIILNAVDERKAIMVSEKIRNEIEQNPFITSDAVTLSVTASFGIAVHDGHPDYNNLVSQSDTALYRAKTEGRNRIETYSRT